MIDPAMCRPGRLDKMLYVDLPNQEERTKILKTLTKKTPLAVTDEHQVDFLLDSIARDSRCDGFSGADLAALVREASVLALREKLKEHRVEEQQGEGNRIKQNATTYQVSVNQGHFAAALDKVQPSVGLAQRKKYNSLRSRLSGFPGGRNTDHKDSNERQGGNSVE